MTLMRQKDYYVAVVLLNLPFTGWLRYKNTSKFWKLDTVEKLYLLRDAVLSKSWDTVLKNLANGANFGRTRINCARSIISPRRQHPFQLAT